jgi:hypothetical protein
VVPALGTEDAVTPGQKLYQDYMHTMGMARARSSLAWGKKKNVDALQWESAASKGATPGNVMQYVKASAPVSIEAKGGRCCTCGYDGPDETPCLSREDRTHCVHWWDGPDEALPNSGDEEGSEGR